MEYLELKEKHQEETEKLPIYWAFGKKQYEELKSKLGLKSDDEVKEKCFGIFGGLAFKKDKDNIINTLKRHNEELKESLKDDDFLQSAIEYELSNHEYVITYDKEETLNALGITYDDFIKDDRLQRVFKIASDNYLESMKKMGW